MLITSLETFSVFIKKFELFQYIYTYILINKTKVANKIFVAIFNTYTYISHVLIHNT